MSDALTDHISALTDDHGEAVDPEAANVPSDVLLEDPIDLSSEPEPEQEPDTSDSVDDGDVVEDDTPATPALQEVQRQNSGLVAQVAELREERRQANEAMQSLHKMFMDMERKQAEEEERARLQREYEEDIERYGEEVVNDPSVSYIRERIARFEDAQLAQQQAEEHRRQQIAEQTRQWQQQQQQEQLLRSTIEQQEEAFRKANPDYDDAYKFAREKRAEMYKVRGYDENTAQMMVNQEELFLMQEQLSRGQSVPEQVYNIAKQWGYTGKQEEKQVGRDGAPQTQRDEIDFHRIKSGLGNQGIGRVPGGSSGDFGSRGGRQMSAEEFFSTVDAGTRLRLLSDDAVFEKLGRTGKIFVPNGM